MDQVTVKEKPILMSAPMVRAILSGRKTQTRRIVKHVLYKNPCDIRVVQDGPQIYGAGGVWLSLSCPYVAAGDRLWLREAWGLAAGNFEYLAIRYKADESRRTIPGKTLADVGSNNWSWLGCTHVHAGCTHCYAESFAQRYGKAKWGPNGTRVLTSVANWRKPLKWNREAEASGVRAKVFCASLADVFEDWSGPIVDSHGEQLEVDGDAFPRYQYAMNHARAQLFKLIDATPWLDWQLLTKRPENVRRMWCSHVNTDGKPPSMLRRENVWIGTSVSDPKSIQQLRHLLQLGDLVPVLFVSAEPLLESVDLSPFMPERGEPMPAIDEADRGGLDWMLNEMAIRPSLNEFYDCPGMWKDYEEYAAWKRLNRGKPLPRISWLIVGGESGGKRRDCGVDAIVSVVRQCQDAGVACFVKQDCAMRAGTQGRIPDDVWAVKEFPQPPEAT